MTLNSPPRKAVSLRRRKQFAMVQPSGAGRIDLGLILPDVPADARLESAAGFNALFTHDGRVSTSQAPSGSRTAATTRSKTCGPGSTLTRMTEPAMTPGRVPAMSTRARRPPVCPCRQYRYSAPGVETTLYRRLVGVTDGLGVPRTLT